MQADLTAAVSRAVMRAQERARAAGSSQVEPRHLLFALLDEENQATLFLTRAGCDVAALQAREVMNPVPGRAAPLGRAVVDGTAVGGAAAGGTGPVPDGPAVQALLERSGRLAAGFANDRSIAGEHVILALLRAEAGLRGELEDFGFSMDKLEELIRLEYEPSLRLEEPLSLANPPEQIGGGRVLDASFNRAREALRVIEDYCRFVLDDAFLTGTAKGMRHELHAAESSLPSMLLLEARDTRHDVGTDLEGATEMRRHSNVAVMQANVKRLQEALRSLEEFSKPIDPLFSSRFESLRYQSYTLEKAAVLGSRARERLADARLYVLLTPEHCLLALDWTIQEAAAGGAKIFQLRDKDLDDRALVKRAAEVRRWTRAAGVLFVMNDRADIAQLVDADGVHLGQDDLSVKDARRIVGPEKLIGVSTHDIEQVHRALLDGADYLGIGPTFPSATKGFDRLGGLEFLRQAAAETSLPAFAIGGITVDNVGKVVAGGLRRIAVGQGITQVEDPRGTAQTLVQALEG